MLNNDTSSKFSKKSADINKKTSAKATHLDDEDVEIEVDEYDFQKPQSSNHCGCGCGSHSAHY